MPIENACDEDLQGAEEWPVPASGYRFFVLGMMFLVYMMNYIDRQIVVILAEPIKREFGLMDWQLGFLTGTAFALLYATLGIPIARLADRANRVHIIAVALTVWSAMTMLCGAATSFAQLAVARVGVGVGEAGGSPPAVSLIASYFGPARRATAMSVYSLGATVGILVGFSLAGWIASTHGWRTAFVAAGLPGLLLAIGVRLWVAEPRLRHNRAVAARPPPALRETLRILISIPAWRFLNAAAVAAGIAVYGFMAWMPVYLIRRFGVSTQEVGTAVGLAAGLAGSVGVFLGGWWADRLGRVDARRQLLAPALSTLMFPLAAYLALHAQSWERSIALLVPAYGLCLAYTGPTWAALQGAAPPAMRAMAAAILLFLVNLLGLGLGPQLVGLASDLNAADGVAGLRTAICVVCSTSVVASLCFYRGANAGGALSVAGRNDSVPE